MWEDFEGLHEALRRNWKSGLPSLERRIKCVRKVGRDGELWKGARYPGKEDEVCVRTDQDSNPESDGTFGFLTDLTRLLGFEKIIHPRSIRDLLCARLCLALGIQ